MIARIMKLRVLMLLLYVIPGIFVNAEEGPTFDKWSLWSSTTQLRGANIWQTRSYKGTYDYVERASVLGGGGADSALPVVRIRPGRWRGPGRAS